ncbi:response regulator [Marinospirillum perlucidum]|uniref:response regulator n=1 Tax=Marinospirillum perlucidum TaxID=1982602 RepID=UPI000DF43785|nr:response regulator [Marinospirillum perlucidum]
MDKTLLLVEDEPHLLNNIAEMLELEGYQVIQCKQGQEGLTALKNQLPELIICDIMMPVMDGFEFLKAVRSHPQTAHLPFIFLTAKSSEQDQELGRKLGADDYLTKPFTRAGLLKAIQLRLGKHHSLSHLKQERQQLNGGSHNQAVALRIAAVEGDTQTLEELVEELGDIDLPDQQGNSALMFAVMMRNEEAARLLLQAGANPNLQHQKTRLSVRAMAWAMGLRRLAREMDG